MSNVAYSKLIYIQEQLTELRNNLSELTEMVFNKQLPISTSLTTEILNQKEFYNGHGQFTISSLNLKQIKLILDELGESINEYNNIFYLALFSESNTWSGAIYQSGGISTNVDKLWATIDNVVIGNDDED